MTESTYSSNDEFSIVEIFRLAGYKLIRGSRALLPAIAIPLVVIMFATYITDGPNDTGGRALLARIFSGMAYVMLIVLTTRVVVDDSKNVDWLSSLKWTANEGWLYVLAIMLNLIVQLPFTLSILANEHLDSVAGIHINETIALTIGVIASGLVASRLFPALPGIASQNDHGLRWAWCATRHHRTFSAGILLTIALVVLPAIALVGAAVENTASYLIVECLAGVGAIAFAAIASEFYLRLSNRHGDNP